MTTTRTVRVGDLAFRIVETADVDPTSGPTIVLVHGIGMSHRYFSRLHRQLAARGRVISVDLPGFGGVPAPSRDVSIPEMAAGLASALDRVGGGPVALVGHSMGAQWVIELAARHPASVSSVVIIGPVVDFRHRSAVRQAVALGVDTLGESPLINAIVFSDYLRCGLPWYLRHLTHMLAYRTEQRIRDVERPVLVIRGAKDPVAGREWCRALRDRAIGARLVEIPHHHHVAQHSAPRAVAAAIVDHLDGVEAVTLRSSGR